MEVIRISAQGHPAHPPAVPAVRLRRFIEVNGKITSGGRVRTPAVPAGLNDPMRKPGAAFTQAEREALGLTGRLPSAVLTLEQRALRAYGQLRRQGSDLAKNVYLGQSTGR